MKTAISTKEIEMVQRKQELENLMVKSSKEIEDYQEILNNFKNYFLPLTEYQYTMYLLQIITHDHRRLKNFF